jgi:hypothetical protein
MFQEQVIKDWMIKRKLLEPKAANRAPPPYDTAAIYHKAFLLFCCPERDIKHQWTSKSCWRSAIQLRFVLVICWLIKARLPNWLKVGPTRVCCPRWSLASLRRAANSLAQVPGWLLDQSFKSNNAA